MTDDEDALVKPSETGFAEWTSLAWEGGIRSEHISWKPSDALKEEKIQAKLRERCLDDARELVPDEAEMRRLSDVKTALAGEDIFHKAGREEATRILGKCSALAATNIFYLSQQPLEKLGVPVGDPNGDDLVIEAGLSWKTRRENPENCATKKDFTELGWPPSAGNPIRWVSFEEEKAILSYFADSGLTLPGSPAPLTTKSLATILETPQAEVTWLIKDILREGAPMMIYGPTGVGKSWLTHSLALLIAQGGVPNPAFLVEGLIEAGSRPRRILIIDGEMILGDLRNRTLQLYAMPDDPQDSGFAQVQIAAKSDQDPETIFIDLADPQWKSRIISEVRKGGYGLVIFDNLSTLSPTLDDENSAVAWTPLNNLLVALKKEKVAAIVVHHTGKAQDFEKHHVSWRGSSNLGTPLETIIGLGPVKGEKFHGARFKVYVDKARNENEIALDGRILQLRAGSAIWESEVDTLGECETVLRMVQSKRFPRKLDLAAELGLKDYELSRIFIAIDAQGFDAFKDFKPLHPGDSAMADFG
jgi:hypothetical protein